jgi:hypothetical protein
VWYLWLFGNCITLVNHHILIGNHLHAEEQMWYHSHLQQLKAKGKAKKRKVKHAAATTLVSPLESPSSSSPSLSTC